jgi:hypothetical protein
VYSLERADRFSVDPHTGEVVSTASFLGQAGTIFTLTAVARDLGGREGGLAATAKLIVSICQLLYVPFCMCFYSEVKLPLTKPDLILNMRPCFIISVNKGSSAMFKRPYTISSVIIVFY